MTLKNQLVFVCLSLLLLSIATRTGEDPLWQMDTGAGRAVPGDPGYGWVSGWRRHSDWAGDNDAPLQTDTAFAVRRAMRQTALEQLRADAVVIQARLEAAKSELAMLERQIAVWRSLYPAGLVLGRRLALSSTGTPPGNQPHRRAKPVAMIPIPRPPGLAPSMTAAAPSAIAFINEGEPHPPLQLVVRPPAAEPSPPRPLTSKPRQGLPVASQRDSGGRGGRAQAMASAINVRSAAPQASRPVEPTKATALLPPLPAARQVLLRRIANAAPVDRPTATANAPAAGRAASKLAVKPAKMPPLPVRIKRPEPARADIIRRIQKRLDRAACDPGPLDGIWGGRTAAALQRFAEASKLSIQTEQPGLTAMRAIEADGNTRCPLNCGADQLVRNGRCIDPPQPAPQPVVQPARASQSATPPEPPPQPENSWMSNVFRDY